MALGPFYVAQKLMDTKGPRGTAILMRHGETAWNKQGRVMGRHPVELTDHGRAQVVATAQVIPLAVNGYLARPRNTRGFCGKLPSGPAADFLWVAARTPHLFPPPPSQPPAPQLSDDRVQISPSPSFGD